MEKIEFENRVSGLTNEGYHFDFNKYVKHGFNLFKSNLLALVAFTSLQILLVSVATYYLVKDGLNVEDIANLSKSELSPDDVKVIKVVFKYLILQLLITSPFSAGIYYGIRLADKGKSFISYVDFFQGMKKYGLQMLLLNILYYLVVMLGAILIFPGIYFGVAFMIAPAILVSGNASVLRSLEVSRKLITKHWFSFLGIMLIYFFLTLILSTSLPLLLVFLSPFFMSVVYAIYSDLFWEEPEVIE
ncbi:hypothetical protein [Aureibacter tunicatorum]|uniref:Uncharacterized protein n=1 Tax=Aureibacter tunicatorum TaxID=866807 RepID=A0AAE4BSX1_9BACT|nr:hypothetical protein [Aureibacter tunicatorum]MDR6240221.1 hypothetical protein [Aureibacter tunicatorum]